MTGAFEGHAFPGEHRTCGRRAWSHIAAEWCYPEIPCSRCHAFLHGEPEELLAERDRLAAELEEERARRAELAEILRELLELEALPSAAEASASFAERQARRDAAWRRAEEACPLPPEWQEA